MPKRNTKYNRRSTGRAYNRRPTGRAYSNAEQVLRTIAWGVVVIAFAIVSHPATSTESAELGAALATMLAATLWLTRNG